MVLFIRIYVQIPKCYSIKPIQHPQNQWDVHSDTSQAAQHLSPTQQNILSIILSNKQFFTASINNTMDHQI